MGHPVYIYIYIYIYICVYIIFLMSILREFFIEIIQIEWAKHGVSGNFDLSIERKRISLYLSVSLTYASLERDRYVKAIFRLFLRADCLPGELTYSIRIISIEFSRLFFKN